MIKVLDKRHFDVTRPICLGFVVFLSALAEDEIEHVFASQPMVPATIASLEFRWVAAQVNQAATARARERAAEGECTR